MNIVCHTPQGIEKRVGREYESDRGREGENMYITQGQQQKHHHRRTNWFLWHAPTPADVPAAYNLCAVSLLPSIVILVAIELNFESNESSCISFLYFTFFELYLNLSLLNSCRETWRS